MSKSLPLRAHEAAAYAAGRLAQIRRVVKPQPVSSFGPLPSDAVAEEERPGLWSISSYGKGVRQYMGLTPFSRADGIEYFRRFCPYGAPGDTLALRECWATATSDAGPCVCYKADYHRWYLPDGDDGSVDYSKYPGGVFANWASDLESGVEGKWEPSTRMPLWAVRWHPVITAVRLERNDSGVWEWVIDVEGVKA